MTKLLSFFGAFCFGITLKTLQVGAGKMSVYYGAVCLKAAIGNEEWGMRNEEWGMRG